ncbi:DUF1776 domain-containing protein, partial [Neisseria gonorrhoeae]
MLFYCSVNFLQHSQKPFRPICRLPQSALINHTRYRIILISIIFIPIGFLTAKPFYRIYQSARQKTFHSNLFPICTTLQSLIPW